MNIPVNFAMWGNGYLANHRINRINDQFRWGATEAAPVGLIVTIVSAMTFYKAPANLVAVESAKGVWSSLVILLNHLDGDITISSRSRSERFSSNKK